MESNIYSQLKDVDLKQYWVDVNEKNGEKKLQVEKKSNWGRFKATMLQIVTFGTHGHKSKGLERVAQAINRVAQAINTELKEALGKDNVDSSQIEGLIDSISNITTIKKPPKRIGIIMSDVFKTISGKDEQIIPRCDLPHRIKLAEINPGLNAATIFMEKEDLSEVLGKYQELNEIDRNLANVYLLGKDANGKTAFHHLLQEGNLQFTTLSSIQKALKNDRLFYQCLVTEKDNDGKSMLDLSIETGQMAVVAKFFPIPIPEQEVVIDEDKRHIADVLKNLIVALANQRGSADNYDQLNHMLSAIHALACYGFGKDIRETVIGLSDKERGRLPQEISEYAKLSDDEIQSLYNALSNECDMLSSESEVARKENEWQVVNPPSRQTSEVIQFGQMVEQYKNRVLFGIISSFLLQEDSGTKNGFFNLLSELLNPYAPYDQKVDFNDYNYISYEGIPILHDVIDRVVSDEKIEVDEAIEVIEMLIHKCPDFLFMIDRKGKDVFAMIDNLGDNNRTRALKSALEKLKEDLPTTLFKLRTKKALKYYLEAKGNELRAAILGM